MTGPVKKNRFLTKLSA